jgi:rubrerythrin
MVTTVGNETELDELVEDLVKLDFAAIEAYDAAIERLSMPEYQRQMREFRNDHLNHTQVLGTWLREHGHTPPDRGGAKELLTKGKVLIAGLAGDKQVLQAMKTNEDDTNTAYERAIKHEEAGDLATVFEKNLSDERRHRAWIETTIATL